MQISTVEPRNRKQVKKFIEMPHWLYQDVPQWVPPFRFEQRRMLDPKRNSFFNHSQAVFLLAENEGSPIGRLAIINNRNYNEYNNERTAFFYMLECIEDVAVFTEMFEEACDWARGQGLDRIIGPKGFSPLDGSGMLVRGFDYRPAFGLPYNMPYYPSFLEEFGFKSVSESVSGYLSASIDLPEKIQEIAELVQKRRGLKVQQLRTKNDLRAIIPQLKDIYNAALGGTTGNVPLTDEEVSQITDQMLWFADPALIKIVMKDDQAVGFLFAYPDISAALQRTGGKLFLFGWIDVLLELRRTKWININGAGMIEGYRGLGGTAVLFTEMYKSVTQSRYRHADVVQIGVENDKMQREMKDIGVDFYKTHRMYELSL